MKEFKNFNFIMINYNFISTSLEIQIFTHFTERYFTERIEIPINNITSIAFEITEDKLIIHVIHESLKEIKDPKVILILNPQKLKAGIIDFNGNITPIKIMNSTILITKGKKIKVYKITPNSLKTSYKKIKEQKIIEI